MFTTHIKFTGPQYTHHISQYDSMRLNPTHVYVHVQRYPSKKAVGTKGNSASKCSEQVMFIFGLGYTGSRFAAELLEDGWEVWATVRSAEAQERFTASGVHCVMFTDDAPMDPAQQVFAGFSSCRAMNIPISGFYRDIISEM